MNNDLISCFNVSNNHKNKSQILDSSPQLFVCASFQPSLESSQQTARENLLLKKPLFTFLISHYDTTVIMSGYETGLLSPQIFCAVKVKGKVTLFNVGSSFSYETGINGSRRCALYPSCLCQCSVLRVFKAMATRIRGKSKQTLNSLTIEPETSRSESRALAN